MINYDKDAKRPSFIIPAGEYPGQVISAEEKTSKAGNPMLVVDVEVYATDGKSKIITDYIVLGGEYPKDWKLKHLAESAGIPVTGSLSAEEVVQRGVRVKVKINPPKNGYGEENAIADYIVKKSGDVAAASQAVDATTHVAPREVRPTGPIIDDGSVPF